MSSIFGHFVLPHVITILSPLCSWGFSIIDIGASGLPGTGLCSVGHFLFLLVFCLPPSHPPPYSLSDNNYKIAACKKS